MIINAGIIRIVIRDSYRDKLAAAMLKEADIIVKQLHQKLPEVKP